MTASTLPPPPKPTSGPKPQQPTSSAAVFKKPTAKPTADRIFLYGQNGWGKTSMAAHAPGTFMIEVGTEMGYQKLLSNGLVPAVAGHVDEINDWPVLMATVESLVGNGDFRTLVIDSASVAQQILRDHVVKVDFRGDDSENGFGRYGAGWQSVQSKWYEFLAALDRLWLEGKSIILVGHASIRPNKDPEEGDYDQFEPDLNSKVWGATNSWADSVIFGKVSALTETKGNKVKALAGNETRRVAYFRDTGAVKAKNRHGLPVKMNLSDPKRAGESDNPIERAATRLWENFFKNA